MMKSTKVIKCIISVLSLVFLLIVILYASVWSVDKTHKVNARVSTLKLNVYHFDMSHYMRENIYGNNSELYILYFFDEFNKEEIEDVEKTCKDIDIKVYIISSYQNFEQNLTEARETFSDNTNFIYAYDDDKASALSSFISELKYPYYLWSDKNCVLKYSSTDSILNQSSEIALTYLGREIGNQVGQYCYTRNITTLKIEDGTLVDDKVFNVKNNHGKITIINFWGYWCTPCKQELPFFNQIQEEYKDSVTVIAIHQGSTFKTGNKMESYHINEAYKYINNNNFSILWGYDDVADTYYSMLGGESTYPISLIVDQNGDVAFVRIGSLSYEELNNEVLRLLK